MDRRPEIFFTLGMVQVEKGDREEGNPQSGKRHPLPSRGRLYPRSGRQTKRSIDGFMPCAAVAKTSQRLFARDHGQSPWRIPASSLGRRGAHLIARDPFFSALPRETIVDWKYSRNCPDSET